MQANKIVFSKFVYGRGRGNTYGRSVFVHDGVLYSCANQILCNVQLYHVEENGQPAKNAFAMARFIRGRNNTCLLRSSRWDGRFMTLNDHFQGLLQVIPHTMQTFWVGNIFPETPEHHASNLRSLVERAYGWKGKALRARLYGNAYMQKSFRLASFAARYAKEFGFENLCDMFLEIKVPCDQALKQIDHCLKLQEIQGLELREGTLVPIEA